MAVNDRHGHADSQGAPQLAEHIWSPNAWRLHDRRRDVGHPGRGHRRAARRFRRGRARGARATPRAGQRCRPRGQLDTGRGPFPPCSSTRASSPSVPDGGRSGWGKVLAMMTTCLAGELGRPRTVQLLGRRRAAGRSTSSAPPPREDRRIFAECASNAAAHVQRGDARVRPAPARGTSPNPVG